MGTKSTRSDDSAHCPTQQSYQNRVANRDGQPEVFGADRASHHRTDQYPSNSTEGCGRRTPAPVSG